MPEGSAATLRVIAVRHLQFEDLGLLEGLLVGRGHTVSYLDAWDDDLDSARSVDLVVVLGGPIGVYQEPEYPFLQSERELVQWRLEHELPTLGICLGAQLMASAMGAAVTPGAERELGYGPVQLTTAGLTSPLAKLQGVRVLHWHGDCCQLPVGAELLASTRACPVQAFAIGDFALALQFHAETDRGGIEPWLVGHSFEISSSRVSTVAELRRGADLWAGPLADAGTAMFGKWLNTLGL